MARSGYHKLTPAELSKRGLSPTSERYVRDRDLASFNRTRSKQGALDQSLSRRQYDNLRYVDLGWKSRDDFERRFDEGHRDMAGYRRWRDAAIANGVATPNEIDRPGSEFNRRFLRARAHNFDRGRAGKRPGSAFAQFLVYVGLRDDRADFDVGGTP